MPSISPPIPIAFCITDLDVGGAERALVHLVTRLDRREWNPVVFCLSGPGALVVELEAAHVPVTCLGANRNDGFFRRLRIVWRLARELRALSPRPRLLQTFLFHANLAGRIAGRLAGIKRIVSGIRVAEKRAQWHLRLDWLTNWLIDLNVCVSQSVADFTRERGRLCASKLTVIPNGVDYERFAQAESADLTSLGIPRESRVILTVGRLDEQKGHRFLIEAFSSVLREHRDARLLIVGEGPLREELQALARQFGVDEAVCFAGYRDDVPALLRASHCFVLPSLWEGMPNVVLEAMAAGVPVVATSVEGVLELIEPERTGLVVKVGDAAELASALKRLLGASGLSLQLAQSAQQSVRERFTHNNSAELYIQAYHQLLSQ
jgi:glycosyltransferase involved in cell wall biosynthesis